MANKSNCTEEQLQVQVRTDCSLLIIVGSVALAILLTAIAVLVYAVYCLHKKLKRRATTTASNAVLLVREQLSSTLRDFPVLPAYLIPRCDLTYCKPLGEGSFGTVALYVLRGQTNVAVKQMKPSPSCADCSNFIEELKTMLSIGNSDRIIRVLGFVDCNDGKFVSLFVYFSSELLY
jgi:hypothetical protein